MQLYIFTAQWSARVYSALGGLQVGCQTQSNQLMQVRVVGSNIPSVGHRTRVAAVLAVVHCQKAVGSQLFLHRPWVISSALQAGRPSESSRTQAAATAIRKARRMKTGNGMKMVTLVHYTIH